MVKGAPGTFWGQKALQGELTTLADMKEQVNYKASFMISIIALQSWTWLREECNEVQFSAWLAAIIEESAAPKCSGLAVERTHSSPTATQAYSEICPQTSAGRLGSALSIFQERGWGACHESCQCQGIKKGAFELARSFLPRSLITTAQHAVFRLLGDKKLPRVFQLFWSSSNTCSNPGSQ